MKQADVKFVKAQYDKIVHCPNPVDCDSCPDRGRFLSLLIKSEAMREKAEFWRKYPTHELAISDAHQWLDADWQEFVEKEWGI